MIINADAIDALKNLPDSHVHALITDPPAGISFMGKSWDGDRGGRKEWCAWMESVMRECFRVMKPGAHGLVWALPRTSHWTATALEDAGFEIRDVITHHFGSGFPKSHDISKAIDKAAGAEREVLGKKTYGSGNQYDGGKLSGRSSGLQGTSVTRAVSLETIPSTDAAKQWNGWGTALKPASERWILCRKPLQSEGLLEKTDTFNVQEWVETFLSIEKSWLNIWDALSNPTSKSTIKTKSDMITELRILKFLILGLTQNITILDEMKANGNESFANSATQGLNDVLGRLKDLNIITAQEHVISLADIYAELISSFQKNEQEATKGPSSEDYILVRKPCSEKTVAANILKHGVGGLNIDASRVGPNPGYKYPNGPGGSSFSIGAGNDGSSPASIKSTKGRFPANLILSHSDHCTETQCDLECPVKMLDGQSGITKTGGDPRKTKQKSTGIFGMGAQIPDGPSFAGDTGGASRFFYCAKASKTDKNAGLEGMPKKRKSHMQTGNGTGRSSMKEGFPDTFQQNFHPTVKSTKLMQYLIKLITPPGGVVLDPFMGSGSTGVAAKALGFDFIGIERDTEYFEIADKRIANG